ncbi:MAG TPA: PAS domain-containing protein [Bacteroidia bacterium]|nr:PAS domain-containing protein [Bacteroidia bacterium]
MKNLKIIFLITIIPQLFIYANLVLRKFTPPAMKQFNFHPSDVGKSIYEIAMHEPFTNANEYNMAIPYDLKKTNYIHMKFKIIFALIRS